MILPTKNIRFGGMRKSVDVDMMNGMKMTLNINFSSNDEEQPTPTLARYNSIDRLP